MTDSSSPANADQTTHTQNGSTTSNPSSSQNPYTIPSTPADLPPEALDLASKLFNYARQGDTTSLSTYLSAGIPPNLTNSSGDTLLMLASYHNHPETVSMLLEKGADVNQVNARGQSPLAGAVFKGYEEVCRVLIDAGADKLGGHPTAEDCVRMFKRWDIGRMMGMDVPI